MNLKKALLILGGLIVAAIIAGFAIDRSHSAATTVVTARVRRENLAAIVSGTGQIKPKTFVNVGATAFGRITHLYVKEGEQVKRGQILATIENVQAKADVDSQKATIASAETDIASFAAAVQTARATIARSEADLQQKQTDWKRTQQLYKDQLIARQAYDQKKADYDTAVATLAQSKAQLAQAQAQTASARSKYNAARAQLKSDYDALSKTVSYAPFDGIVTNMPVRVGETVVVGIQNALGSTLMTLADMSVITAEVYVDETDIVNVAVGQPADIVVDALPGEVFRGRVTEVGDQAILRSTGIATSQSTAGIDQAKDFKVVVTLDHPSSELRPGLSATAKIITARRENVLSIPIQALTVRTPGAATAGASSDPSWAIADPATARASDLQGVFIVGSKKGKLTADFVPVRTGVMGTTNVEVVGGLRQGEEIITGPYNALRDLRSGAAIKRDRSAASNTKSTSI